MVKKVVTVQMLELTLGLGQVLAAARVGRMVLVAGHSCCHQV